MSFPEEGGRTHGRRNNQLRAQPSEEMHENKYRNTVRVEVVWSCLCVLPKRDIKLSAGAISNAIQWHSHATATLRHSLGVRSAQHPLAAGADAAQAPAQQPVRLLGCLWLVVMGNCPQGLHSNAFYLSMSSNEELQH